MIMQKNKNRPDWDRIYERSKALSRTSNPIKAPLLALPYGKPPLPSKWYKVEHNIKMLNALTHGRTAQSSVVFQRITLKNTGKAWGRGYTTHPCMVLSIVIIKTKDHTSGSDTTIMHGRQSI